jgi:hypothetical protein
MFTVASTYAKFVQLAVLGVAERVGDDGRLHDDRLLDRPLEALAKEAQ